ncbi:hypothetical protein PAXRUDRAFT_825202 [Paxillus rubicundulus Ve08.2h10]|uniref:Uncharacterized protein n=1 Tax=Paxillus rubicundulus Ve08.2h10 TaxID=930991 RepID=A0A0D0E0U9_9AGAM|nr:hypothetical protein PAXRUDRAFT_825202 [Paxillus rubicundulus Ve08.2h10]
MRLALGVDAAHPFELVTLCPSSAIIMRKLWERSSQVSDCVCASQKSCKPTSNAKCNGKADSESEDSDSRDVQLELTE